MSDSPLAGFAKSHGLTYAEKVELPEQGGTLTKSSGRLEGTAKGALPGGIEGTLCRFTYVYKWTDSDNNTREEDRPLTLVVTAVPESIGFVPYLGFAGPASYLDQMAGGEDMAAIEMQHVKALRGYSAYAYKGTSERWLAQLLSPALVQWLGRCAEDFGIELASGVLIAGRNGYLSEPREIEELCEDAAHLAGRIREESLEEVGTSGESEAARDVGFADPRTEAALAAVTVPSPANLAEAAPAFASHLRRSPPTYLRAIRSGLLWGLVFNVPAVAIPIVLIANDLITPLLIYEGLLFLVIAFFSFRSRVRNESRRYGAEAFFRAYAADRELALDEPLGFLATHAEAKLSFKPDRVFSGILPGGASGSLAVIGDGTKRANRIAVIAGPRGPVAEEEVLAEAPGLSAATLDEYAQRLGAEVAEDLATRPAAES